MNLWLAISLVLAVLTIYLFTIEIFSVALKLTGMATSKIKFQVASLFTGTGYTTAESELVAKDEKRRKIAMACIYTGHIFSVAFMGLIINVVISLSLTIYKPSDHPHFNEWYFIVLYVTIGLLLLVLFIKIPPINRRFQRLLESIAINASRKKKQSNLLTVLDIHGKHAIVEVVLNILPEFANEKPLSQMEPIRVLDINVLSIKRDSRFVEVTKDTMFKKGDVVIIYGLTNDIKEAFINSVGKVKKLEELDRSNQINLLNNYGSNALVEVFIDDVPSQLENISIADSKIKEKFDITIVIIKRNNEYIMVNKDTILQKGDTVTLHGPYQNIKVLFKNE